MNDDINNNANGILDPEGIHKNPLTHNDYSPQYKELASWWSKLPAYKIVDSALEDIRNNQVLLITSGTGSGKTVLFPKYVLHTFNYNKKIIITLPKQVIVKSAAEFSAKTLDVTLGEEVGYQYRGSEPEYKSQKTLLLYATDGTVVQRILHNNFKDISALIIDEAHERKVQIDFLLYLAKNLLRTRPDFKLIIMSATINTQLFASYFNEFKFKAIDIGSEPGFPIDEIWMDKSIGLGYLKRGYDIIKKLIQSEQTIILIFFVTSIKEEQEICRRIVDDKLDAFCIEVYSGFAHGNPERELLLTSRDLYKEKTGKKSKIILASPVAESSLTIEGVNYVIDSGYEFSSSYSVDLEAHSLKKRLISKAQVRQRMGRTGRTNNGTCYHLYTHDEYESMIDYPEPEIRISDISQETLSILNNRSINSVENVIKIYGEFIEPPTDKYIRHAIKTLTTYQLLTNDEINDLGHIISRLNVDIMSGVALTVAKKLGCLNSVIAILTTIEQIKNSMKGLFIEPRDEREEKEFINAISVYKNNYGDHIAIFKIIKKFIKSATKSNTKSNTKVDTTGGAKRDYINTRVLSKVYKYYMYRKNQIRRSLRSIDTDTNNKKDKIIKRIIKSLQTGYSAQYAYLSNKQNLLYNTSHADNVKIDKLSFVKMIGKSPDIVFYHELFDGTKLNLNIVTRAY